MNRIRLFLIIKCITAWMVTAGCSKKNYPSDPTPSKTEGPSTSKTDSLPRERSHSQAEDLTESFEVSGPCGLSFTNGICLDVTWNEKPIERQSLSLNLRTFRLNAGSSMATLEDLTETLTIEAVMPDMGHGTSPVRIEKLKTGVYRVSEIYFSMGGEWELRFHKRSARGDVETVTFVIEI